MFSEWLNRKNQNFTSPEFQNEISKEMGLSILLDIVESIKNIEFHSIMVDETSDVSNKEQVDFCVCWVDENMFSHQAFLGLHEMEKDDALSIANYIRNIILRLGFDSKEMLG